MPFIITVGIHLSGRQSFLLTLLQNIFLLLGFSNSAVKPVLYAIKLKTYRSALRHLGKKNPAELQDAVDLRNFSFRSRVTGAMTTVSSAMPGSLHSIPPVVVSEWDGPSGNPDSRRRSYSPAFMDLPPWVPGEMAPAGDLTIGSNAYQLTVNAGQPEYLDIPDPWQYNAAEAE